MHAHNVRSGLLAPQRTQMHDPLPMRSRRSMKVAAGASGSGSAVTEPALPASLGAKHELRQRLLRAKEASGKTFSQIADEVGLTNVYTAQLFHNQQQLQPNTVAALAKAVPQLSKEDLEAMQRAPFRDFEPNILQEPAVYRLYEAIMHGGESIKAIINEKFGDGIMSAIGFFVTVDRLEGLEGEPRVVITFNGKFLPYQEQRTDLNVAQTISKRGAQ